MELLSICIPTYNRKVRLEALLKNLIAWNKNEIPIIVFDNASNDGTDVMVRKYVNKIIYLRNTENLGHDGNYLRLIEDGKKYSKYSLWLGDDDCVTEDFFDDIPTILKNEEPDLVVLNQIHYSNNFFQIVRRIIGGKKNVLNNNKDVIVRDIKYFYNVFYDKLSFGILVVNNTLLETEKACKYKGTFHLYVGGILEALDLQNSNKGEVKVYVTAKPYIIWGKGGKSYTEKLKEVYCGCGSFFAKVPHSIQEEAYYAYKKSIEFGGYGVLAEYMENGFEQESAMKHANNTTVKM